MDNVLDFTLLSFVSLFTMVNPPGVVPVYISMTAELSPEKARRTAFKAIFWSMALLMAFVITGQLIFNFFAISVDTLRIVGGIIFFFMGYDMLNARLSRTKFDEETDEMFMDDIAITPLAIPIICGPGAITTIVILAEDAADPGYYLALTGVTLSVLGLTLAAMLGAERIMKVLGETGNKVLMRLMGLIVMSIAVEFFFAGLTPFVRRMVE